MTETVIEAADSWLVTNGTVLALEAHRTRWLASIPRGRYSQLDPQAFWDAALALIPTEGDWFPRVELQSRSGAPLLVLRLRSAPDRARSVILASWHGDDPRIQPTVKGPDLERMLAIRSSVQAVGAGEAVLLSPDGYVVEGATSALLWWRGEILCGPPAVGPPPPVPHGPEDRAAVPPRGFPRVDSVTARSVLTLATALGIDTHEEAVTPAELDGTELWALNALHGIRIVTRWVDGPELAEQPGRLATWRKRMDALRRPLR